MNITTVPWALLSVDFFSPEAKEPLIGYGSANVLNSTTFADPALERTTDLFTADIVDFGVSISSTPEDLNVINVTAVTEKTAKKRTVPITRHFLNQLLSFGLVDIGLNGDLA